MRMIAATRRDVTLRLSHKELVRTISAAVWQAYVADTLRPWRRKHARALRDKFLGVLQETRQWRARNQR